jgi:hypothetical protein
MSQIESIYSPQVEKQLQTIYSELEKHQKKVLELSKMSVDFYGGKTASSPKGLNETIVKLEKLKNVSIEVSKSARQMEIASKKESDARNALNKQREKSIAQQEKENAKLIESERAYTKLAKAENVAAKQLQDLIARGKLATQTQAQYNAELARAQSSFDLLRAKLIMADNATGRWSRTNERVITNLKAMRNSVGQLMSAFGVFGGIYLFAQVLRDAFKTTVEFDKATADLAATLGKSRKEIIALTNSAKQYGATTIYTATQVTKLQKELGKLGFSETEILNSTGAILNLASAVDTDLEKAAEVGGSTLRAFNLDASEMARVVDVMAKGFTSSALDIDNFRESIKYVAPIASASNVSLEQTTALLGILADNGIKGSQAGTSLRRIMTDIVKTGKPFNEGLRDIVKNGISVKDAFDEVGRTAQTSLVVLGANIEKVDALNSSLNDVAGTAQMMADEQLNSLNGEIKLMTSAWDGFILSLETGNGAISKVLRNLINLLTKAIEGWTFLMKTEEQRSQDAGTQIGEEVYTSALEAIFNESNKLKKEINSVNDLLNKQLSILDKRPNDKQAKANLDATKAQKIALEDLLKTEKDRIKSLTAYTIPQLQEEVDKTRENIGIKEKLIASLQREYDYYNKINLANASPTNVLARKKAESDLIENKEKLNDLIVKQGAQEARLRAYRDAYNQTTEKTIILEEALIGEDDKKIKKRKELEQVEINSKTAFDRQISALQHQIDKTNIASAEYGVLTFQLKLLKDAYKALYGEQEKVSSLTYGTIPYYENEIKLLREKQDLVTDPEQYDQLEKNVKLYEDLIKWIKGVKDETDKAKDATKEWSEEYRKGFQDDFISNSGFDKIFFIIENFDKLKESGVDTALAISEAFQQTFNTIAEASQGNFDREYERLEQQKELALKFAGESATAREEIETQSEAKRKEIARREAEAQKRLAIFNIAINTAQGVISALASTPPNVPLSIAIGVIGAVQAGIVASQQIPQFWKGTENAPEGYAWTQERGAEIITDKKGNIKTLGSKKGAELTYLEKGDKVFTAEKTKGYLNGILQDVGISPLGSYANNIQVQQNTTDFTNLENKISNLASAIKNQDKTVITVYKDKTFTRVGGKELQNARVEIRPRKYTNG